MRVFYYFLAVVLSLTAATSVSHSCGNEYYITPEIPFAKGKLVLKDMLHPPDYKTRSYWQTGFGSDIYDRYYDLKYKIDSLASDSSGALEWASLEKALTNKTDYKLLSDYAWYELRVGEIDLAVKLLEKLYQQHPNEYNIVANLGTAYEVGGHNQKALELLKKAVAIAPSSHFGSEWIHVNILEQKIKAAPDYKAIIKLQAGNDYNAWLNGSVYNKSITADSLMTQIAYQLHERISFIPPQDPAVGQLVLDFADLAALTKGKEAAVDFYGFALLYDSTLVDAIKIRTIGVVPVFQFNEEAISPTVTESKPAAKKWIYFAGIGVIAIVITVLIARRRKSN